PEHLGLGPVAVEDRMGEVRAPPRQGGTPGRRHLRGEHLLREVDRLAGARGEHAPQGLDVLGAGGLVERDADGAGVEAPEVHLPVARSASAGSISSRIVSKTLACFTLTPSRPRPRARRTVSACTRVAMAFSPSGPCQAA